MYREIPIGVAFALTGIAVLVACAFIYLVH